MASRNFARKIGDNARTGRKTPPFSAPPLTVGREASAGHDVMDGRGIRQLPAPRRPHAEEARQIGAQGFLVGGQRLDRLGRSVEQGAIAHARRLREKVPQRLRNGESQPEVMGGQRPLELPGQPAFRLALLADRTVAMAAAACDQRWLAAVLVRVDDRPTGAAPAIDDGLNHPLVAAGHRLAELGQVRRSMATKELLKGAPLRGPPSVH